MERQIKSKSRVSDFGEVYTAKKQVVGMVDLVPIMNEVATTDLEPACGNGNFLAEILDRNMATFNNTNLPFCQLEKLTLLAVSSLYGIDIQVDNVSECRNRLYEQVMKRTSAWLPMFRKTLQAVLAHNIICGNTLTMQANDGNPLVISEWDIKDNGTAVRKDVLFSDMVASGGESTQYIKRHYYRWLPIESKKSA